MNLQGDDGGINNSVRIAVLPAGVLAFLTVTLTVTFALGLIIPGYVLFGLAGIVAAGVLVVKGTKLLGQENRQSIPAPVNDERELLRAIRDNGGIVTPVELAMEVPVSVEEADHRLSELASGGYLLVGNQDGALVYSLPGVTFGQGSRQQIDDGL